MVENICPFFVGIQNLLCIFLWIVSLLGVVGILSLLAIVMVRL